MVLWKLILLKIDEKNLMIWESISMKIVFVIYNSLQRWFNNDSIEYNSLGSIDMTFIFYGTMEIDTTQNWWKKTWWFLYRFQWRFFSWALLVYKDGLTMIQLSIAHWDQ